MPRKNPKAGSKRRKPPVSAAPVATPEKTLRATRIPGQRTQAILDIARIYDELIARRPLEFRVSFARPDDLFVCDFIFDNLKLESGRLVRKDKKSAATLILEFQPQSFGEEAFLDDTGPEVSITPTGDDEFEKSGQKQKNTASTAEPLQPLPSARIRMAGPSRIAFAMPDDEVSLDFTLKSILDACLRWEMRLDVNAVPEPRPRIDRIEPGSFDKNWLATITTAPAWAQATQGVMNALRDARELQAPLDDAAQRLARQSAEALNQGRREGLYTELMRAMNIEIDRLADRFERLRDVREREIAIAFPLVREGAG